MFMFMFKGRQHLQSTCLVSCVRVRVRLQVSLSCWGLIRVLVSRYLNLRGITYDQCVCTEHPVQHSSDVGGMYVRRR